VRKSAESGDVAAIEVAHIAVGYVYLRRGEFVEARVPLRSRRGRVGG
jgi:hypothetical protein